MTTTAPLTPTAPWPGTMPHGLDASAAAPPPEGPGRLRIDPRVVQKLAARAAEEVDGISQASVAPVGRALHRPLPEGTPAGQLAVDLDLAVDVRYPLSLRTAVERLAAHVSARVEQLTGRPVGHLGVHVRGLAGPDAAPGRQVR